MDTRSKPIFVLIGHPLLFDNMLVFPFICFACFVYPHLALFVSMVFACSPYLLCFFLCLFAGLLPYLLHVHAWSEETWSEGMTSYCQQKGQRCMQEDVKPKKGNVQQIRGLASSSGYVLLSPSFSLFSKAYIGVPLHVPPLLFLLFAQAVFLEYDNVCFIFPIPCWAIPLERWQCLIYFFALCGCIVHDVCISISACIWVIVLFV